MTYTTVTLPKPTVGRRSVSKNSENRATSADCWPSSAPILADFFGRPTNFLSKHHSYKFRWPIRLFSLILSTVKRQAPGIGQHSADDRPTAGQQNLWFVLCCFQRMHPYYLWNWIMHLCYFGINFIGTCVQTSGFRVGCLIQSACTSIFRYIYN